MNTTLSHTSDVTVVHSVDLYTMKPTNEHTIELLSSKTTVLHPMELYTTQAPIELTNPNEASDKFTSYLALRV